jgi:hypothetical protein
MLSESASSSLQMDSPCLSVVRVRYMPYTGLY